jgi:hypothetical protein
VATIIIGGAVGAAWPGKPQAASMMLTSNDRKGSILEGRIEGSFMFQLF